ADGSLWVEVDNAGSQSRDLYKVAAAGYARTLVYRNSSDVARLAAVSPDGRFLAYVESSNDLVRSLRIRELQAGRVKALRAGDGFTVYIPLGFSPDGAALLTLTDIDKDFSTHEFRALNRVDMATGEGRDLLQ